MITVRESPAISIVQSLVEEGAEVQGLTIPRLWEHARKVLPADHVRYVGFGIRSPAQDADALLVLTEWGEFKCLDYGRIRDSLRYPIVIAQPRNLLDPDGNARTLSHVHQHRPARRSTRNAYGGFAE